MTSYADLLTVVTDDTGACQGRKNPESASQKNEACEPLGPFLAGGYAPTCP